MADEKICVKFLRAAAELVRRVGLARGLRRNDKGEMCMLGAMDFCDVPITHEERKRIEAHLRTVLPPRPYGTSEAEDNYNFSHGYLGEEPASTIAWWSNTQAKDADEVAEKFLKAAETC